jgi:hypothetical protein
MKGVPTGINSLDGALVYMDDESTGTQESVGVDTASSPDKVKSPDAEACISSFLIVASTLIGTCNNAVSNTQNNYLGAAERHWAPVYPICE